MGQLTPTWFAQLEMSMRISNEDEYARLRTDLFWQRLAGTRPHTTRKERIFWFLSTASISWQGRQGAESKFDEMVMMTTEYETRPAGTGFKVNKNDLDDADAVGANGALLWARDISTQSIYWPQWTLVQQIIANPKAYDGIAYFAENHPNNPFDDSAGLYANLLNSTARAAGPSNGVTPGGLPIHENGAGAVTIEVAFNNLNKAIIHAKSFKMPNGEHPRKLKPSFIMHPPALRNRVLTLLNAKQIAVAVSGTGGASQEVAATVSAWGMGPPIEVDELGSAFGGDDTTYYIVMEQVGSTDLRAWTYLQREGFGIIFHGPQTSNDLARANEFEWKLKGRNYIVPGHPYLMLKVTAVTA